MNKLVKIVGGSLAVLAVGAGIVAGAAVFLSDRKLERIVDVEVTPVDLASTDLARGDQVRALSRVVLGVDIRTGLDQASRLLDVVRVGGIDQLLVERGVGHGLIVAATPTRGQCERDCKHAQADDSGSRARRRACGCAWK